MARLFLFLWVTKSALIFCQQPGDKAIYFGGACFISFGSYKFFESKRTAFDLSFCSGAMAGGVAQVIDRLDFGPGSSSSLKIPLLGALFGTVSFKVKLNFKARKKGNLEDWKGTDLERRQVFVDDSLEILKHRCY